MDKKGGKIDVLLKTLDRFWKYLDGHKNQGRILAFAFALAVIIVSIGVNMAIVIYYLHHYPSGVIQVIETVVK